MKVRPLPAALALVTGASCLALTAQPAVADTPATTSVGTWSDLLTAFATGGTVVLANDITGPAAGSLRAGTTPVTLDLAGHALTVTAGPNDAGIEVGRTAALTVADSVGTGSLVTTGGDSGAGIGGSEYADLDRLDSGSITITGGTVTATGGSQGAGIGGAGGWSAGPVVVTGGTVRAVGGHVGAGIGGGSYGFATSVVISGGTVDARGGYGAAGVGTGYAAFADRDPGSSLDVRTGGALTATAGDRANAIGAGLNAPDTVTVSNSGSITIPAGSTWTIPAGTAVPNSGVITGDGAVDNRGTIALSGTGSVSDTARGGSLRVSGTATLLTFDVNGGTTPAPASLSVYATTPAAGGVTLPAGPTKPEARFVGWFTAATGGTRVTGTTTLTAGSTTLFAQYVPVPVIVTASPSAGPASGGTRVVVTGRNLARTTRVTVGGVTARFGVVSNGRLVVTTPAHALGAAPIRVTTSDGTTNAPGAVATFTYAVLGFDDLAAALRAGGTVPLGADITAPAGSALAIGATAATLDLRGRALRVTAPGTDTAAIGVPTGSAFTVTDSTGGGSLVVVGGDRGAGIGGGRGSGAGRVTIAAGVVTATGGTAAAGIGAGNQGAGVSLTVTGGTVTAAGGANAPGVGGDLGAAPTVTVTGGSLTARGGDYGAGIGGVSGVDGGGVTVGGGTVTATGGLFAAGIGGGFNGNGGTLTVNGGTVVATGGTAGAGVGSGAVAADQPLRGGSVRIAARGSLTARGGVGALSGTDDGTVSAIGAGTGSTDLGTLVNAGTLTVPAGATLRIPTNTAVQNSGLLTGDGTVANAGRILGAGRGTVSDRVLGGGLAVTGNAYRLTFPAGPGVTAPAPLAVYGPTVASTGQQLPVAPARPGFAFSGWRTSTGKTVTATTFLPGLAGAGPQNVALQARYVSTRPTVTAVSPASGPVDGGRTVTLTGTGFTGATSVLFGDAEAGLVTVVSPTTIELQTPSHGAGEVTVTVTTPNGTSLDAPGARYTFLVD